MSHQVLEDVRTRITYSAIFDKKLSLATLKKQLSKFRLSNVISALAQINILLSRELLIGDDVGMQELQGSLVASFIDEDTCENRLKPRFGHARRDMQAIFTRQQILALIRLSFLTCSEKGRLLIDDTKVDRYALGRCALIMNDHLLTETSVKKIKEGKIDNRRRHLALQLAPIFELYNPTDLRHAIVRSDILFSDILDSDAMKERVRQELRGFDLGDAFHVVTGMSLEQYMDFILMMLVPYLGHEREELIRSPGLLRIHLDGYLKNTRIGQKQFHDYLALDSIKLSDLQGRIKQARRTLPYWDFAIFREKPLLELHGDYLLCLDPAFLLEKLGAGIFWTIVNSFGEKKDRDFAFQSFGYLFEFYVDRIMQQIYPPVSGLFLSFSKFQDGQEAFDGMVCLGEHLIVLEYKGGFLKQEAKYNEKIKIFERDLENKFGTGKGGGVNQLVKKIERLFHRDPSSRDCIARVPLTQVNKVMPVMVVREPFLRAPFMNWMLNTRFKKLVKQSKITRRVQIEPLTVIDIDSLEILKNNLIANDFSLVQCLSARASRDRQQLSVFRSLAREQFRSYGKRQDADLETQFDSIFDRVAQSISQEE
jgi:hypothetical protein